MIFKFLSKIDFLFLKATPAKNSLGPELHIVVYSLRISTFSVISLFLEASQPILKPGRP